MDLKSLLYFLAVLSVLVLVHEWGHFFVAKLCKMRVDDFSLFFGPRLVRLGVKNGTEYNIRTIPLGGFVKIAGMEPEDLAVPVNIPSARGSEAERKAEMILHGLTDDLFRGIEFGAVSERVRDIAANAIGSDARLTETGKADLRALLDGPTINEDEQRFLEAVLHTASYQPDPNGYNQKPLYQRAATIFAGPLVSLTFGYLLFCVMGFTVGLPEHIDTLPVIEAITPSKPAALAGLQPGDRIVAINGKKIDNDAAPVAEAIHDSVGKPIQLVVARNGITKSYTMTPYAFDTEDDRGKKIQIGRVGLTFQSKTIYRHYSPVASVGRGTEIMTRQVSGTLAMFGRPKELKENTGGIISVGKIIDKDSKEGIAHVLFTAGILSISLGIMNLLPIPILDGGHLLLLAIEGIRRRKLTTREVAAAQLVGASIIAVLFVFVLYNDISRWFLHPTR